MKVTIYIKDYFPLMISTRKTITNLSCQIKLEAENEYVFDFTDIVFISRSFSDEFIKYLKTANIKWQLKNANDSQIKILKNKPVNQWQIRMCLITTQQSIHHQLC